MYGTVLTLTGILLYAYVVTIGCDPYHAGLISNKNQVSLYSSTTAFKAALNTHLPVVEEMCMSFSSKSLQPQADFHCCVNLSLWLDRIEISLTISGLQLLCKTKSVA